MDEHNIPAGAGQQNEPELRRTKDEPKGVLQKNLKPLMYLGVAVIVIVAAIFSSTGKKGQKPTKGQPPQPMVEDNTDNNVQDLKNQLQAEQQKQQQQAAAAAAMGVNPTAYGTTPNPDYAPGGRYFGCVPGQPCTPQMQQQNPQQLTPEQQQEQQLAAKDRELAYNARFASNLAYTHPSDPLLQQAQAQPERGSGAPAGYPQQPENPNSSLIAPRAPGEPVGEGQGPKRAQEVNIDSAAGQPYVLYEGTTLDAVLMNRLDGDAAGPIKVLVSNPVYSHDHQHVIVPDGTVLLGEARKIGAAGFGQQRRMAVLFHRMIMPDGYSVDLDQFHGLDQIGEEGLKDKVNNHYLQIFGTSIALGVIAGAAQIQQGGGVLAGSGSQVFTAGAASSVSQSATTILDRFMQIPPTITIREGHRVKVYFTQDMLLPAYENHTIPQTF
jgi:type IV secretory pathway VirB10-like protein